MKHYPQDIERVVEERHLEIRQGGYSAAFAIEELQLESIAIVAEIARSSRKSNIDALVRAIRATVANEFALRAAEIVIVKPGYFPKTSSGKTPRRSIKAALLKKELQRVEQDGLAVS